MRIYANQPKKSCPVTSAGLVVEAQRKFDNLLRYCQENNHHSFWKFEKCLFALMRILGLTLVRLYLTSRHERLDLRPYLADGGHRLGDSYAERTVKTAYGEVRYGRAHLLRKRGGGHGFHPLDVALELTRDRLSPWVMQLVGRLATRMSFAATRLVCRSWLRWSPATETIEQVVLGLGRQAAAFLKQLAAPANDGEVLIIEVDGKSPPTATAEELAKRRGRRRPRQGCSCGCQRHRGQSRRKSRGRKKRRQKGDKRKNGKEVTLVVMYTLRRGSDGRLHGPINKRVWGSFAGHKAAALRARAEATKRGFGPDTTKTVQIVMDGAKSLKLQFEPLFPNAIFTLDVCHVVERLWDVGRCFHQEGSAELTAWVEDLKSLLYDGRALELVERLWSYLQQVPGRGPGTKARREGLQELIGYLRPRKAMMRYREWKEQDLVIATGQVEGAVRHVVGERFDNAGMRWTVGKAEPLLQLRCIELNGDWDKFIAWTYQHQQAQLYQRQRVRILTDQPMPIARVA